MFTARFTPRALTVALVLVTAVGAAYAGGEAAFEVEGRTFILSTGTGSGQCMVYDRGPVLGNDIVCRDSAGGYAAGNTRDGCVTIEGSGSCSIGAVSPVHPQFDVYCPGGFTWRIESAAPDGKAGKCHLQKTGGELTGGACDDGEGNSAEVDCTLNGGLGNCLTQMGTARCLCLNCEFRP